jgi:tripartite-type tricarboxylate transporter receptor subunit TctC
MKYFVNSKIAILKLAIILFVPVFAAPSMAQSYPNHSIKFVVPFPPGSATDTSARYFAKKLSDLTSQSVVIENKPGGNSIIAIQSVLSAPADGYTVFIGSNSPMAVNAALFKTLPYDPVKDFSPLTMLTRAPNLLIVPENSSFSTVADLVAKAKEKPGELNYGYGSAGYQLMAELFNETAGVKTTGIPYKGASGAVNAVLSKSIDFAFVEITSSIELVKSGKVKALALSSEKRSPLLPNVPTAIEAGLKGYTAYVWVSAAVSSKTPPKVTAALAALMAKIEDMPETKEFYEKIGAEVMKGGPAEMAAFQKAEIAQWKRVVNAAKIEQQ